MKRIEDVVVALNKRLEQTPLADFYSLRRRLNGGRGKAGGLFQVTHGKGQILSGYSFHWGGRSELQFNIGFEDDGYFRYGVAFSLEPDRNLPDPLAVLYPKTPSIQRRCSGLCAAKEGLNKSDSNAHPL